MKIFLTAILAFGLGHALPNTQIVDIKCEDYKEAIQRGGEFNVPHPSVCDVFLTCNPFEANDDDAAAEAVYVGELNACPAGLVVDQATALCQSVDQVSCEQRKLFQDKFTRNLYATQRQIAKPKGFSKHYSDYCQELYGIFHVPGECQQYVECYHGKGYARSCPDGTIFDKIQQRCEHENFVPRKDCHERAICTGALEFGSHDRVAIDGECIKYHVCTQDQILRSASCVPPLVFDSRSKFCVEQERVPECAQTYTQEQIEEFERRRAEYEQRLLAARLDQ